MDRNDFGITRNCLVTVTEYATKQKLELDHLLPLELRSKILNNVSRIHDAELAGLIISTTTKTVSEVISELTKIVVALVAPQST
jgi:hypothetical protein